jgi:cyanophycin synthetase
LLDGFTDRITAALPALIEHHCGVGRAGWLCAWSSTWMAMLEHIVIERSICRHDRSARPAAPEERRSPHGVPRDEQVARFGPASVGHAPLMATINSELLRCGCRRGLRARQAG